MIVALTLSDVVAPAALVVAVLAVLLAQPIGQSAKSRRERRAAGAALAETEARLAALAGVTARGFASTLSVLDFDAGVLERSLHGRINEADRDALLLTHQELRRGIERAWAEANLFSADPAARQSARDQLNVRLADDHSHSVIQLSAD